MRNLSKIEGKLIRMNKSYPIHNDDDEIVGYTEVGDMAVITFANKDEDYYEIMIVSGKYIGVDTLALNGKDLEKSIFVFNQIDYCGSIVSVQGKEVKNEYL